MVILTLLFFCLTGSLYGYLHADNYESILTVLRELSDLEKKRLVEKVQELVGSSSIEGLTTFIASQIKRDLFVKLIQDFVKDKAKGA